MARKKASPQYEKTPKVANDETTWVQLGTPRELGPKIMCASDGNARMRLRAHLHSLDGHIERHCTEAEKETALKRIADACDEIGVWYIGATPKSIEVLVDEHYNFTLAVKVWKGRK